MDRPTDTQLLDFLQESSIGFGDGWILRQSITGRGMRLHESRGDDWQTVTNRAPNPSVREAIYEAMCDKEDADAASI